MRSVYDKAICKVDWFSEKPHRLYALFFGTMLYAWFRPVIHGFVGVGL